MFVDENRNCISACPEGTFYKETLKQTICKPYLEKKCVRCRWHGMYISNDSCVNVCPSGFRYIDGNNCISQCPEERPFKVITTIHGLSHYKCKNKCPSINDGSFCTNVCPENKVVIGSSCLEQCPSNTSYLLRNSCLKQCPYDAPADGHDNKTCVQSKCPDKRPYVVNNTCVESCPNEFPLTYSTINVYNRGFEYCIKSCGDKYRYKNKCVLVCPSQTVAVKNDCADKCPMYTSYMCTVPVGYNCGEKPGERLAHTICVNECPKSMLIWNNTCVFSCKIGHSTFGRECTETCPVVKPYQQNITNGINCEWGGCKSIKTDLYCR
ncbi:proprotein convertase subtilisin/kexin type 5-like [Ruditapes philippinarum]|uniref:proprotein convertase subtilisin/kexin type 5-like n=1 Tax=Ruditapes philippinarum TaxID=129788 RepID=UPI00295B6EFD|nr:proprotein convertase subtilisin/kexin type 5-like [Ruditapes philippinarum]